MTSIALQKYLCNITFDEEYFWDELYKWVEKNLTHEGV